MCDPFVDVFEEDVVKPLQEGIGLVRRLFDEGNPELYTHSRAPVRARTHTQTITRTYTHTFKHTDTDTRVTRACAGKVRCSSHPGIAKRLAL